MTSSDGTNSGTGSEPPSRLALTVVIPAYNEAHRLAATVRTVREFLDSRDRSWEIIVVSDGSRDDPGSALLPLLHEEPRLRLIEYPDNQGKGAAVKQGVRAAHGQRILFTDADLSTPITELPKLERALEDGADVVIASRRLPGSRLEPAQGFARQFVGRTFSLLVRGLTGLPHLDTQCGFKLFSRESAASIFEMTREARFAFDVELLCAAHEQGLRVAEVPVLWRNATTSSVRLWRDPLDMLAAVARYGDPTRFRRVFDRQIQLACVAALFSILAIRGLGIWTLPLIDNTEGRYGAIVLEMYESGDWITPRVWQGEGQVAFLGKPPLYFWLGALAFELLGPSEGAARLPNLLVSLFMLWLIFVAARALYGSTLAWLSTLVAGSSAMWIGTSGLVALDATAACCATGLIACFVQGSWGPPERARRWHYAFFLFMGLAMLAKGPVVLVLGVAPIVGFVVWARRFDLLRQLPWVSGSGIALAIAAPWYILAERANPGFLEYFLWNEHVLRYLSSEYGDQYGKARTSAYGMSWAMLALSAVPWTLIALGRVRGAGIRMRELLRARSDVLWLVVFWAVTGAVFFTPARSVLPTYLAPSLGGLAILLAREVDRLLHDPQRWRRTLFLAASAPWLSVLGLAGYGLLRPDVVESAGWIVGAAAVAGLAGWWVATRAANRPSQLFLVPAAFAFAIASWWVGLAGRIATEGSTEQLLERARASVEGTARTPIVLLGRGEPSMAYYGRLGLVVINDLADARIGVFLSDDIRQAYIVRTKLQGVARIHHPRLEFVETVGRFSVLREP